MLPVSVKSDKVRLKLDWRRCPVSGPFSGPSMMRGSHEISLGRLLSGADWWSLFSSNTAVLGLGQPSVGVVSSGGKDVSEAL